MGLFDPSVNLEKEQKMLKKIILILVCFVQ